MISVVIPYSEEQTYLVRCLNAIGRQTYRDVQLLLIAAECDPEIAEQYGLEVIESGNEQPYGGINEAIGRVQGGYLYFCSITSVPAPNTLELLLREYDANQGILKYGKCYVEKAQGFEECEGMQASCYGRLYDMKVIRDRNIRFSENSAFAEMQFIAEYAVSMNDLVPVENVSIYETDLQCIRPKYMDEGIDAADWIDLLEQIGRLNEEIAGQLVEVLCQQLEYYPVISREVLDITQECSRNRQLQYTVARAILRFWWTEAREQHNYNAFEDMKACLAKYEDDEAYLELLLLACGIQRDQYSYLKNQDMRAALYFISESCRLKGYDEYSVNAADSRSDSLREVSVKKKPVQGMRTGLVKTGSTWFYYRNDEIDWDYVGLAKNQFGWYYVRNGMLDQNYDGIIRNRYGAWCVEKGTINRKVNGYHKVGNQEAFFNGGKVDINKSGFLYSNGVWRIYDKGVVDVQYSGMVKNEHGWWYVEKGEINYAFEGLAENEHGWWYIKDGTIDYTFKGYARNMDGWHYVENGKIQDNEPKPVVTEQAVEIPNQDVHIAVKEELKGTELAEYAVGKYASGELGLKTIFSSLGAWLKYKL